MFSLKFQATEQSSNTLCASCVQQKNYQKKTSENQKLTDNFIRNCFENRKLKSGKLKVLYRNLIRILITFLRIVHSCICKLLAGKRNAESCL